MSHLFLWVGRHAEARCAAAQDHFLQWKGRSCDAVLSTASVGLVVAGSQQRPAGIGAQNDAGTLSLGWCGHLWPSSGPDAAHTRLAAPPPDLADALMALRERFDGVFALALVDSARGTAAVASDLLGSFHLYWRQFDDGVAVCSSSLLLARMARSALDPVGVQEYLSLAVALEERCLWQGIAKLRGGTVLRIAADGRCALLPHRPLIGRLAATDVPLDAAIDHMHSAIGPVLGRLLADGTAVADVTGGNDSRALAAALVAHGHRFVSSVTGPADLDDVVISARLAAIGGWPHDPRLPSPPPDWPTLRAALQLTDGEFDAFEFSGIANVHRTHVARGWQVSLNGSYGETGRGYPWRLGPKAIVLGNRLARGLLARTPVDAALQGAMRFRPPENGLLRADLRLNWAAHGAAMVERMATRYPGLPQCAQLDLLHIDLRMERWQGRIASSTNQIWPAVSPWGFQEPLAALLTADPRARRNSLLTRTYTARMAPKLADVLLFTGNPARPFRWRDAASFLPAVGWYGKRAREKLQARLTPPVAELPPMDRRQAAALDSGPLRQWLAQPALAATGLMDEAALLAALRTDAPRNAASATLWCRLVTLESALRAVAGDAAFAA